MDPASEMDFWRQEIMGRKFSPELIEAHLVSGEMVPGEEKAAPNTHTAPSLYHNLVGLLPPPAPDAQPDHRTQRKQEVGHVLAKF